MLKNNQSVLCGTYLAKNPALVFFLKLVDLLSAILLNNNEDPAKIPESPRSILLCNGAHLGDLVLSTALIPLLREAYPNSSIGMLVGSWSRCVIVGHPDIEYIHEIDHWRLDRNSRSKLKSFMSYYRTRRKALREIRSVNYQVSIDLYPYFPNNIFLTWQSRIPLRLGYTSAGFGRFLNMPLDWVNNDISVTQYHYNLLKLINKNIQYKDTLHPSLPVSNTQSSSFLPPNFKDFAVVHMGTGQKQKEWPLSNWQELVRRLISCNKFVVFTGYGQREKKHAELVIPSDSLQTYNLVNQLCWTEFVALIKSASFVVCVDSVCGHVASAFDIPVVTIGHGMTNPSHWAPLGNRSRYVYTNVSCSPCYEFKGCDQMKCIRSTSVSAVISNMKELGVPF